MLRFTFTDAKTGELLEVHQYQSGRLTSRRFKSMMYALDYNLTEYAHSHSIRMICESVEHGKATYLFNIYAFDYEGYIEAPDDEFYPDRCIYRLITLKAASSPSFYRKRYVIAC